MVRKSLFNSAALAVIAAAGLFAIPAQAQERGRGEDVDRTEMREARIERQQQRAEARQQRSEAPAETQGERSGGWRPEAPRPRVEAVTRQGGEPDRTWRSQRAEPGTYGRDWTNGGAVNRPAPAYRGATPATPERGVGEDSARRDRTTSTPAWGDRARQSGNSDRNGSYPDGRTAGGYRDNTRQGDYRDGYRDRTWQQGGYRDGYRSGGYDRNRDAYGSVQRRWDHNSWRRDHRYDWRHYRTTNRSLFSIGRYYSPYRNYNYSRLNIGIFLDRGFYGNRYWINDPWQYRLPDVYGPYRWVRYYDDVLLVDIYSGEVVDVIYDFFW